MWTRALLLVVVCVASTHSATVSSKSSILDNDLFILVQRILKNIVLAIGPGDSEVLSLIKQDPWPQNMPFPCDVTLARSLVKPQSVAKLRLGDIDVIAAMGDSLTASNGGAASDWSQIALEARGISWSGGGSEDWRTITTLPNILKEFNPNLVGFSIGNYYSYQKGSQFNVAEAGAHTDDMVYMAKRLLERMQLDPRVDMKNDWKLITMMVGGNDYCTDFCVMPRPEDMVHFHRKNILEALRYIRDNFPRTFVNLVTCPPPTFSKSLKNVTSACFVMRRYFCACLFADSYEKYFQRYIKIIKECSNAEEEVAQLDEFKGLKDFAVVYQPFMNEISLPKQDTTLLAPDCFHFSQKGHAAVAMQLFKNMLQPVGMKDRIWNDALPQIACPDENNPFLKT